MSSVKVGNKFLRMENNFLKERIKDVSWLENGLDKMMDLSNKSVEGKRNFLIPTTAVSATIIAGLFIFMAATRDYDGYFKLLAMWSALLFALHIITSHIYLTALLSLESRGLDDELFLRKNTLRAYREKISNGIIDPNIYSEVLTSVRDKRNKLKYAQKFLRFFSQETCFIIPNILFIIAFVVLFVAFLYRIQGSHDYLFYFRVPGVLELCNQKLSTWGFCFSLPRGVE